MKRFFARTSVFHKLREPRIAGRKWIEDDNTGGGEIPIFRPAICTTRLNCRHVEDAYSRSNFSLRYSPPLNELHPGHPLWRHCLFELLFAFRWQAEFCLRKVFRNILSEFKYKNCIDGNFLFSPRNVSQISNFTIDRIVGNCRPISYPSLLELFLWNNRISLMERIDAITFVYSLLYPIILFYSPWSVHAQNPVKNDGGHRIVPASWHQLAVPIARLCLLMRFTCTLHLYPTINYNCHCQNPIRILWRPPLWYTEPRGGSPELPFLCDTNEPH